MGHSLSRHWERTASMPGSNPIPALAVITLLILALVVLCAILAPLSVSWVQSPAYVFLLFEAPGVVIEIAKIPLTAMGTTFATLAYQRVTSETCSDGVKNYTPDCEALLEEVGESDLLEKECLANVRCLLLQRPRLMERYPALRILFESGMLPAGDGSPFQLPESGLKKGDLDVDGNEDEPTPQERLLGKVRKCKFETVVEVLEKASRSIFILFVTFCTSFGWMGFLMASTIVGGIIWCQKGLRPSLTEQDLAFSKMIKQLKISGEKDGSKKPLVKSLNSFGEYTKALGIQRTVRNLAYFMGFFILDIYMDNAVVRSLYKDVISFRDAVDKIFSWHVQLGEIIGNGNRKIVRSTIQLWWLSNEEHEEAVRIMDSAKVRAMKTEGRSKYGSIAPPHDMTMKYNDSLC